MDNNDAVKLDNDTMLDNNRDLPSSQKAKYARQGERRKFNAVFELLNISKIRVGFICSSSCSTILFYYTSSEADTRKCRLYLFQFCDILVEVEVKPMKYDLSTNDTSSVTEWASKCIRTKRRSRSNLVINNIFERLGSNNDSF